MTNKEFIEVLVLSRESDIVVAKSLLDANGIPYFIDGENFSKMYGSAIQTRICVPEDKADEARVILKEFQ
ncbi:MAG: hypothetical protein ACI9E5_001085 [Candidatus Omnitrophota bacterium]|jgi:hypothetical protein